MLTTRKAETFHPKPWFNADEAGHGYSGPLHTEPHEFAPISNLLLDSFVSKGLPLDHDVFTTGNSPAACGNAPRTVHKGIRTTGADFITNDYHRGNITIMTEATVDKVVLESAGEQGHRATGVVVAAADGTRSTVHARKEVIVSGGSYCSPTILMRSGIGGKDELEKHQIPCQVDLPGVGKNLMDHLVSLHGGMQVNIS